MDFAGEFPQFSGTVLVPCWLTMQTPGDPKLYLSEVEEQVCWDKWYPWNEYIPSFCTTCQDSGFY
jgi:hypothetical protein